MEDSFTTFIQDESHTTLNKVKGIMYGLRCGRYPKCVFLVGAGISVAAGYPVVDRNIESPFSPYASPYDWYAALLPFCVDADPTPFHTIMHEHAWKVYTQNIDGLEELPFEDDSYIGPQVKYFHGRLADGGSCVDCGEHLPWDTYKEQIIAMHVYCPKCRGNVRPNITLYGEKINIDLDEVKTDLKNADLVICAGTSLAVYPFADLLNYVTCPTIIVDTKITHNHAKHAAPGRILYNGDCQTL